ncbi:MAG: hypothetical protein AAGD25_09250 [Cyanobacteria bacterium P01_F01_bin.150]
MSPALKFAIIAAHFSVYIVSAISVWIFSRRSQFYQTTVKLRSLPFIYCGYASFAIAASYEIAEHMADDWIYRSQISGLNRLFYTFIVAGVSLIAMGLKKAWWTDLLLIASVIITAVTYGINDSKSFIQISQLIAAAIFVYHWYVTMRDWRVFLYVVFSNILALAAGIVLIATGNQVWHVFIGPLSAIALLILGYVAWVRPYRNV